MNMSSLNQPTTDPYSDPHDPNTPPKKLIFSVLLGITVGFLIGAAILVLIRVIESETDGMNALIVCLQVFAPLALLTGFVWFFGRSNASGGMHLPLLLSALLIGGAVAGAISQMVPSEQQLAQTILSENRELFHTRAAQLAELHMLVESVPVGTAGDATTDEQKTALQELEMDVRNTDHPRGPEWNTLLTCKAEYARLKKDTDPQSIMDDWDRPNREFPRDDRYKYSSDSEVDAIAVYAHSDDYVWMDELQRSLDDAQKMRYVIYLRVAKENSPVLTGEEFQGGFKSGDAFIYDLEKSEMVSSFSFAATNSERVEYTYAENENVAGKESSAMQSVIDDLDKNLWPAFWNRLHQLAPKTKSDYSDLELPYKPTALAQAYLIWQEKKKADEEAAVKVEAELKAKGLDGKF